jgi:hypothetical protein
MSTAPQQPHLDTPAHQLHRHIEDLLFAEAEAGSHIVKTPRSGEDELSVSTEMAVAPSGAAPTKWGRTGVTVSAPNLYSSTSLIVYA